MEVRSLTHKLILQLKDTDEVTSTEEIIEELRKSSDSMKYVQCDILKSLRVATISLSAYLPNNLLNAGKIKIE